MEQEAKRERGSAMVMAVFVLFLLATTGTVRTAVGVAWVWTAQPEVVALRARVRITPTNIIEFISFFIVASLCKFVYSFICLDCGLKTDSISEVKQ